MSRGQHFTSSARLSFVSYETARENGRGALDYLWDSWVEVAEFL